MSKNAGKKDVDFRRTGTLSQKYCSTKFPHREDIRGAQRSPIKVCVLLCMCYNLEIKTQKKILTMAEQKVSEVLII